MGRVEDALRRLAEEKEATHAPVAAEDAVALASEPFPLEMPDRPRLRPAPVKPALPAATEPAAVPPTETPVPEAPVEAKVPTRSNTLSALFERLDAGLAQKIVVDQNMQPGSREQYRRLAAALHHAQNTTGLKVIMVASAVAGEGKTLTASNLALTLSESYQREVLMIDADLRRPSLHTVFRIASDTGLSEGLTSKEERKLPLHQVSPRLTILPAGRPTSDPMAGLTSERMKRLVQEARESFDWVIIDTPPVGLLTDANLLSTIADAAVLVVKAGETPYQLVQRAVEALGRKNIIGVVLNRATVASDGSRYADYKYYYGPRA